MTMGYLFSYAVGAIVGAGGVIMEAGGVVVQLGT